jgi:hypothetical protein
MRSRLLLISILLAGTFLVAGCKTTLLVHDTTTKKLIPIVKDYAGTHGYRITYENDATGSFGLDMGAVYVPYSSSTVKSSTYTQYPTRENQPLTAYEQTTWNTVGNSEHYVQAAASVTMVQAGNDVMMTLDGNDVAGSSLNDIYDYLRSLGYQVDNK